MIFSGFSVRRSYGRGAVRSWFRQLLRVGMWMALFMMAAAVILKSGFPNLDPAAALQWMRDSWVLLLLVRLSVYSLVVWYGPVLHGVRDGDLGRARLSLAGCAALLEGFGTLRLIL